MNPYYMVTVKRFDGVKSFGASNRCVFRKLIHAREYGEREARSGREVVIYYVTSDSEAVIAQALRGAYTLTDCPSPVSK